MKIGDKLEKNDDKTKSLSIKYNSSTIDDEKIYLEFSIETPTIKSSTGTIFVEEMNADNEIAVPKTIITGVKSNSKQSFKLSFDKNKVFNRYTFQENFSYQATITIDGLSGKTDEFKLNFTKNKTLKSEKCLCKKTSWSADDLKYIVTQLRKKDIQGDRVFRDKNNNIIWLDKNGEKIPNSDKGGKPKEAKKPYTYKYSLYEVEAFDGKLIEDRLFYLNSNGLNIRESEANYNDFVKQLNFIFKKYEINTCIRKIHFLAQVYVETLKLSTTYEANPSSSVSGGDYYRGRGIKQLTHDYNYLQYYDYRKKTNFYKLYISNRLKVPINKPQETVENFNVRTNNQFIPVDKMDEVNSLVKLISTEIAYACDSSAWYWWAKKINKYADDDNFFKVCAMVNHPEAINSESINGYEEREKYYNLLKSIFDYENCK